MQAVGVVDGVAGLVAQEPQARRFAVALHGEEVLALEALEAPGVAAGAESEVVHLYTWSSSGGRVTRHAVHLNADGSVSVSRTPVASHVGAHDPP